mmetsp:Transcript_31993/g.31291  ORF Transcript_31993/g.31291 Transcript_31993/m.31291 type:complete len:85 (-) Transcript_31993:63-317(-)
MGVLIPEDNNTRLPEIIPRKAATNQRGSSNPGTRRRAMNGEKLYGQTGKTSLVYPPRMGTIASPKFMNDLLINRAGKNYNIILD